MGYKPRLVDAILKQKLRVSGGVLVEGPKWCGKTTTALEVAKSALLLGNPVELQRAKILALNDSESLLAGSTPRLVDEWQVMPMLWDAARFAIDRRGKFGQFIFTGSSVPVSSDEIIHTGTGRFARLKMRPMSLYESGDSVGTASLAKMFEGGKVKGDNPLSANKLAYLVCRGGFPSAVLMRNQKDSLMISREYHNAIVNVDLSRVDNVRRNSDYVARLLRSYARFQGEQVSLTDIQNDMSGATGEAPNINTISAYHEALKKMFVVEDLVAWNPNLRSKAAIRATDTRYFVDPSLAVAALDTDPDGLFADLNTFGFVFETLCMRDLRVYVEALGGSVAHYRDSNGLECDAVVRIPGGKYGLVQMKLGGSEEEIESAVSKMKALANIIDSTKMKEPAFMMVLTGVSKYAYRREDGAYVVPVGCLKP